MRLGNTIRGKAILALEEAVQELRYDRVRRTYALRFALAYLYDLQPGKREPYDALWAALDSDNTVLRYKQADHALTEICVHLGAVRDEEAMNECWRAAYARHQENRGG